MLLNISALEAREINVGIGTSLAPYIDRTNSSGAELQVIREVLALEGLTLKVKFLSADGGFMNYRAGLVEAILINHVAHDDSIQDIKGYPSDDVLQYHNFGITLQSSGLRLQSLQDLKYYRVLSFYNASKFGGREHADAVKESPLYLEVPDQVDQVHALYRGHTDVVIADPVIFNHYRVRFIAG